MTLWAGFILGCVATFVFVAKTSRVPAAKHRVANEAPVCEVKIKIWKTVPGDIESLVSDFGGGRMGVSHTSVDLCETDENGVSLMVECLPRQGVIRVPASKYGSRPHATIVIGGYAGAHLRGCVQAKVGQAYDRLGIFAALDNARAMMCSTLVYQCLPSRLRKLVLPARPEKAMGIVVTPAQLMQAFGARVGGPTIYVQ
jgi:hypothetical protein